MYSFIFTCSVRLKWVSLTVFHYWYSNNFLILQHTIINIPLVIAEYPKVPIFSLYIVLDLIQIRWLLHRIVYLCEIVCLSCYGSSQHSHFSLTPIIATSVVFVFFLYYRKIGHSASLKHCNLGQGKVFCLYF